MGIMDLTDEENASTRQKNGADKKIDYEKLCNKLIGYICIKEDKDFKDVLKEFLGE